MVRLRLPRAARIGPRAEIQLVVRKGRAFPGPLMRLHFLARDTGHARLAVSAPRRIGGAVQRNRWKRLAREAFRLHRKEVGPGLDIVVVPQIAPAGLKRQDVEAELLAAVASFRRRRR